MKKIIFIILTWFWLSGAICEEKDVIRLVEKHFGKDSGVVALECLDASICGKWETGTGLIAYKDGENTFMALIQYDPGTEIVTGVFPLERSARELVDHTNHQIGGE